MKRLILVCILLLVIPLVCAWTNNAYFDSQTDHLGINESLGQVISSFDHNDLSILKNASISTAKGSTTYSQHLRFNSSWFSPRLRYIETDDDVVTDTLFIMDADYIFQYDINFNNGLVSEVSSSELADLRGADIIILGSNYSFVKARLTNDVNLGLSLVEDMLNTTITQGELNTYELVDGSIYEVSIYDINTSMSPPEVKLSVNGVLTKYLSNGESDMLSNLCVGVWNVTNNSAHFYMGRNWLEIEDTNVSDGDYDTGILRVNGENIDDAYIKIEGSALFTSYFTINNISYRIKADDDLYITPGSGLRSVIPEEEALITPYWDIKYNGLNHSNFSDTNHYVPIIIYHTQDNASYYMNFTNTASENYSFPLIDNSNASNLSFKYGTHNNTFHFFEGFINTSGCNTSSCVFNIRLGDYFVINHLSDEYNSSTISTVLRYASINTSNQTITFIKASGSGDTISINYTNNSGVANVTGEGNLTVAGVIHEVIIENSTDYSLAIDMNSDGDINTSDEVRITVRGGGILDLGVQNNLSGRTNTTLSLITLSNDFEEFAGNETTNITITGNETAHTVDIIPGLTTYSPNRSSNTAQGMTRYGALFNHTYVNTTSDLLIYYPLSQVFGNASIEESIPLNISLLVSSTTVAAEDFNFSVRVNTSYFTSCAYRIVNESSAVWNHSSGTKNFTKSFDGIYLPVGNWTIIVNATDYYDHVVSRNATIESVAAIETNLTGSSSATATIGGSDISFTFDIITKGYPYVKFYMNLSSGSNTYDVSYASIGNSSTRKNISGASSYAGAEAFVLPNISNAPAYAMITTGLYRYNHTTLRITPYSGLSAGTYTGSYGWGLFDSE
ncbi:MAG TPA: hypothetical protein ENL16_00935 [Candidatus Woesearchaeota archaeon]|nr:hypothetical protein [Candidatus Woesearchaeota archaeon]